ncbi:hypothetical protein B0H10DRAFT_1974958 [Mycena sp. CBHHK59/15]|nr:hypothetical protein B0H10DRAFT_1974958 [Mycena sp. CBHHK59/15]
MPCVSHGHFEYEWHGTHPGWGLDVPLVSARQVGHVLFGPNGPPEPVGEDCIAATFPVAAEANNYPPPGLETTLGQDKHENASQNREQLHAGDPTKFARVNRPTLDMRTPNIAKSDLVTLAETSRSQASNHLPSQNLSNQTQRPYEEESPAEWINRAVRDLYDVSVPASDAKTHFQDAFFKEQTGPWPPPPPDYKWADYRRPHPECDRCGLQQAHLVTFCPSKLSDTNRIHPPVSTWNAFIPANLLPHFPLLPISIRQYRLNSLYHLCPSMQRISRPSPPVT